MQLSLSFNDVSFDVFVELFIFINLIKLLTIYKKINRNIKLY